MRAFQDPRTECSLSISFREPPTVAETRVVGAEDLFDLGSSFDLSYFCIQRETFEAIMRDLGLPERFLAIICGLREESVFSYAGNWERNDKKKWMS